MRRLPEQSRRRERLDEKGSRTRRAFGRVRGAFNQLSTIQKIAVGVVGVTAAVAGARWAFQNRGDIKEVLTHRDAAVDAAKTGAAAVRAQTSRAGQRAGRLVGLGSGPTAPEPPPGGGSGADVPAPKPGEVKPSLKTGGAGAAEKSAELGSAGKAGSGPKDASEPKGFLANLGDKVRTKTGRWVVGGTAGLTTLAAGGGIAEHSGAIDVVPNWGKEGGASALCAPADIGSALKASGSQGATLKYIGGTRVAIPSSAAQTASVGQDVAGGRWAGLGHVFSAMKSFCQPDAGSGAAASTPGPDQNVDGSPASSNHGDDVGGSQASAGDDVGPGASAGDAVGDTGDAQPGDLVDDLIVEPDEDNPVDNTDNEQPLVDTDDAGSANGGDDVAAGNTDGSDDVGGSDASAGDNVGPQTPDKPEGPDKPEAPAKPRPDPTPATAGDIHDSFHFSHRRGVVAAITMAAKHQGATQLPAAKVAAKVSGGVENAYYIGGQGKTVLNGIRAAGLTSETPNFEPTEASIRKALGNGKGVLLIGGDEAAKHVYVAGIDPNNKDRFIVGVSGSDSATWTQDTLNKFLSQYVAIAVDGPAGVKNPAAQQNQMLASSGANNVAKSGVARAEALARMQVPYGGNYTNAGVVKQVQPKVKMTPPLGMPLIDWMFKQGGAPNEMRPAGADAGDIIGVDENLDGQKDWLAIADKQGDDAIIGSQLHGKVVKVPIKYLNDEGARVTAMPAPGTQPTQSALLRPDWKENYLKNGNQAVVDAARLYLGTPYDWKLEGGVGDGDGELQCAELKEAAFKRGAGIDLPLDGRWSQYVPLKPEKLLQPGKDVAKPQPGYGAVYYSPEYKSYHVAIVSDSRAPSGANNIIHASAYFGKVVEGPAWNDPDIGKFLGFFVPGHPKHDALPAPGM